MAAAALAIARAARGRDVVYAAGMYTRSALAARALGVPLVVKLAGDPVYERSRRLGLFDGTQEEFEAAAGTPLVRVLRRVRAFASPSSPILRRTLT